MKTRDIASLLTLAGPWGASYMVMRIGAHEFGAMTRQRPCPGRGCR